MINRVVTFVGVVLATAGLALAAETTAAPATAPSTRPAASIEQRVAQLIAQLGDEDFKVRDQATEELKNLGKPALPAMKDAAARSNDPEVKNRVEAVVAALEKPARPQPRPVQVRPDGGAIQIRVIQGGAGAVIVGGQQNVAVRKTVADGVTTIDAEEDGKKIQIKEDADGIEMSVTEPRDGKEVTEQYKAKNVEELKKNHPDAAGLYEKYNQGGLDGIRIQQIKVRVNAGPGGVVEPDQNEAK